MRWVMLASWLVLAASLIGAPTGAADESSELAPMDAIVIEGDADFCDDEDGDGIVGIDDGIVNCATADGTSLRPYIIEGWTIAILESDVCLDLDPGGASPLECGLPGRCMQPANETGIVYVGALNVCLTTKHVVIRNVEVNVGGPFRVSYDAGEGNGCPGTSETPSVESLQEERCDIHIVGANLWGASNVSFQRLSLSAYSTGISVRWARNATGESFPARDVALVDSEIRGASSADVSQAMAIVDERPDLSRLITACNAQLTIRNTTIDATGHNMGVVVGDGLNESCNDESRLLLEDSSVSNASITGVSVYGLNATLRGSTFAGNGLGGASSGQFANVLLSGDAFISTDRFEIVDNQFGMAGPGVQGLRFETRGQGVVEQNRFVFDGTEYPRGLTNGIAILNLAGFACGAQAEYNDFGPFRVVNNDPNCELPGRRNWWGLDTGPSRTAQFVEAYNQVEGRVDTAEWLRLAPSALPSVIVSDPKSGGEVYGVTSLSGTAEIAAGAGPITRVELYTQEAGWADAIVAAGNESWHAEMDMGAEPPGELALRIRGCVEIECGFPIRFGLKVVPFPLPPVAVLRAGAVIAKVGESIDFDASGSYSPQGRPIVAYRFHWGDGQASDWTSDARTSASYESAGVQRASVDIRDSDGFESVSPGTVTLRITSESSPRDAGVFGSVPAPGPIAFILAVVAIAVLQGRASRRSRR